MYSLKQIKITSSKSNALYFQLLTILLNRKKNVTVLVLVIAFRYALSVHVRKVLQKLNETLATTYLC